MRGSARPRRLPTPPAPLNTPGAIPRAGRQPSTRFVLTRSWVTPRGQDPWKRVPGFRRPHPRTLPWAGPSPLWQTHPAAPGAESWGPPREPCKEGVVLGTLTWCHLVITCVPPPRSLPSADAPRPGPAAVSSPVSSTGQKHALLPGPRISRPPNLTTLVPDQESGLGLEPKLSEGTCCTSSPHPEPALL